MLITQVSIKYSNINRKLLVDYKDLDGEREDVETKPLPGIGTYYFDSKLEPTAQGHVLRTSMIEGVEAQIKRLEEFKRDLENLDVTCRMVIDRGRERYSVNSLCAAQEGSIDD